jgi:hypothetical protein
MKSELAGVCWLAENAAARGLAGLKMRDIIIWYDMTRANFSVMRDQYPLGLYRWMMFDGTSMLLAGRAFVASIAYPSLLVRLR